MSSLKLNGSTSGYVEIVPPAVAGNNSVTLPSGSGTLVTGDSGGNLNVSGIVTATSFVIGAGSTASPSLSPTGDSNTGIFFPAADTIAFGEGGSEVMRINSSARLLVGFSTGRSNFDNSTNTVRVQIEGGDGSSSSLALISNANATFFEQPRLILAKSQGFGTGKTGLVANGDVLADISFQGSDGTQFVEAARIRCEIDSTPGADDMPSRLIFSTTRDGASSPVEWLRLDSTGKFGAFGRLNGNPYYGSTSYYADAHTVCRVFGVDSTSTSWADQKSALFVNGNFGAGGNNQVPCSSLTVINWPSGATNPGAIMRGWRGDASLNEGTPVLRFEIAANGNVTNTNNSYGALSDIRYKQDIIDSNSQWEDIKNIKIRKFRFIDDVKNETDEKPAPYLLGCIAQEVQEISPGLVELRGDDKDEDGNEIPEVLTLKYSVLYMKAIKALQEAMERIETLEAELAALKNS